MDQKMGETNIMAKKVVTFGELMIRLQPYHYERFVQADHLEFTDRKSVV